MAKKVKPAKKVQAARKVKVAAGKYRGAFARA